MNELAQANDLKNISTGKLKQELAKSLDITASHLNYLAKIWAELEARGEDLSELRRGILLYLPLIANNKVDSRIVIGYAGQKTLLSALSRLPLDEQSKLVDSGYVTTVNLDDDGGKVEVQKELSKLTASEVYKVFSDDDIRSPDEQYKLIAVKESQALTRPKKNYRKARRVSFDKDAGVLIVSNVSADMSRVVEQVSQYYGVNLMAFINKEKS